MNDHGQSVVLLEPPSNQPPPRQPGPPPASPTSTEPFPSPPRPAGTGSSEKKTTCKPSTKTEHPPPAALPPATTAVQKSKQGEGGPTDKLHDLPGDEAGTEEEGEAPTRPNTPPPSPPSSTAAPGTHTYKLNYLTTAEREPELPPTSRCRDGDRRRRGAQICRRNERTSKSPLWSREEKKGRGERLVKWYLDVSSKIHGLVRASVRIFT